jgi:hypothetical protein
MSLSRYTRNAVAASVLLAVAFSGAACGTQTASDAGSTAPAKLRSYVDPRSYVGTPSAEPGPAGISADSAERNGAEKNRPYAGRPVPDAKP